jgi:hypothetical protein
MSTGQGIPALARVPEVQSGRCMATLRDLHKKPGTALQGNRRSSDFLPELDAVLEGRLAPIPFS